MISENTRFSFHCYSDPDLRSQRLAILEYARKHDFRIDDFIEALEQASEKRRRAFVSLYAWTRRAPARSQRRLTAR